MIYTEFVEQIEQEGRGATGVYAKYVAKGTTFEREAAVKTVSDAYAKLREWRAEFRDSIPSKSKKPQVVNEATATSTPF